MALPGLPTFCSPPWMHTRAPLAAPPQARLLFHCAHKRGDEAALMQRHQELGEALEDELSLASVGRGCWMRHGGGVAVWGGGFAFCAQGCNLCFGG